MTRLAAIAVERGWERIDFQVLDWNPARGFYRQLGIEHLGEWLRYGGDAAALCLAGDGGRRPSPNRYQDAIEASAKRAYPNLFRLFLGRKRGIA
ncbi:MAG: hypothetical protein WA709_00600 [Stellaceae bacterium]